MLSLYFVLSSSFVLSHTCSNNARLSHSKHFYVNSVLNTAASMMQQGQLSRDSRFTVDASDSGTFWTHCAIKWKKTDKMTYIISANHN